MQMKPDTRTLMELFERDVRYVVPLYQRPYVWNADRQWEPLWEDIRVLLDHQIPDIRSPNGSPSHFLGAIVLEQQTQAPGAIPLYTVIDGQQRLTTLQILLAAASKVAEEVGAENDAALLRELAENNRRKATGDELFKVWPTNANRAAFRAVMKPGGPTSDREDDPANRIDEAFGYFVDRFSEWIHDEPDSQRRGELMRTLRVTLSDLLKVVSITLEPGDNAQVIFETLNARGTPLLALDLVKNAVFHEASHQKKDIDALYESVWKPELDADYWRKEKRQGRLFRPRADLFLMHWLGMKLRRVIPATEMFTTFRKDVLGAVPAPKMDELIEELCHDARIMREFDDQPRGSAEALFFERLETLDITTLMPLVLLLFTESAISIERRRRALGTLESWLVRRALVRLTVKHYNRLIPAILARVADDPSGADEIILDELRKTSAEVSRWPTDQEVQDYLMQHDAYGNIAKPRLVMALAAVERSLYSHKTELLDVPKKLSLEHVMPQNWKRNWPLADASSEEERLKAEQAREQRIHRLGNLTLTAGALNSALSNSAWPTKRHALNRETRLLLNVRLIEENPISFDEAAIDARTLWLSERICSIWPGPGSWD